MKKFYTISCTAFFGFMMGVWSLGIAQTPGYNTSKFKQLDEVLPTPNVYRTGSGEPGPNYWQQKADYDISVTLNDQEQTLNAKEAITYYNNSPQTLRYLWVQLDQNVRSSESDKYKTRTLSIGKRTSFRNLNYMVNEPEFDGGFNIQFVRDKTGKDMDFTIVKTMMRIDLEEPMEPGDNTTFYIGWDYKINDATIEGRGGYEYFEEDGNYLYEIAQWFPRMAVYDDFNGWQHKQFLGRGEFALTFGDYKVSITAPADHIVAATGVLQNPKDVLTSAQRQRLEKAKGAEKPVMVVTEEEAIENEKEGTEKTKTWVFEAENVRDFAWASSRKFLWDAKSVKIGGKQIMAMSLYPKEGNPLWGMYSTEVVAHTLEVYSKYSINYPYPVAWSIHGAVFGMEYPMICFNGGRPEPDGTYSETVKYAMIGVIIHEVGHNFFPMIVNSDERQWTWMDEGLNTFCQYLTEVEWQRDFPHRRGPAWKIVPYMKGEKEGMVPIMTNSESILQFGNNAYGKPATALNILRETILGRELFDYAFKEYSRRWAFKHPKPADFFRTMEDASGVDLDWFWRGWFYTTDHVDISIESVDYLKVDSKDPRIEKPIARKKQEMLLDDKHHRMNAEWVPKTLMEERPDLRDFYNKYDKFEVTEWDIQAYERYYESLDSTKQDLLDTSRHFYSINFKNKGGLVMPIILKIVYKDKSEELRIYPAEIWKKDNEEINKVVVCQKPVESFHLDPLRETADTDTENNHYPRQMVPSRFELYKGRTWSDLPNEMRKVQQREKQKKEGE